MAKQEATNEQQRGATMITHLMVVGFSIIVFCMMFTDQLDISYTLNGVAYQGVGSWKDVLLGEYNALPTFFGYLIYGVVAVGAIIPLLRESDHRGSLPLNIILAVLSTIGLILISIIIPLYKSSSASFLCEGNKLCIDSFKEGSVYSIKGGVISAIIFATFVTALQYYLIYSDILKRREKVYKTQSKNKNLK